MATAAHPHSTLLRQQIEQALAGRVHASLTLAPRLVREGHTTGYETLDAVLHGGLPVAGTSEIVGARSSGRATLAAAYLAERTREGHVCAWIDVAGDLTPEAAMADGVDLDRVLWIRCAGEVSELRACTTPLKADFKIISYARDRSIGTPGVANRPLIQNEKREVQVASDRQPKRRGDLVLLRQQSAPAVTNQPTPAARSFTKPKRPWTRLEQAIKSVDLLVQAGGFGAIVLDLGGIAPEFTRKIPLATWFRWRAALERTRTSLVVLSQMGCAGSSAELMLRVEAELPPPGTILPEITYRLQVIRRRFAEATPGSKKPSASAWQSRADWVAS